MRSSSVTDNSASLQAALPDSVDALAIAGGIHLAGNAAASIRSSSISRNTVTMTNTLGSTEAFSAAIHADLDQNDAPIPLELRNDIIADNRVMSSALGSSGDANGDSAAGEISGEITNSQVTGNTVVVKSARGDATALGGAGIVSGSITNSVIRGNAVSASSPHGSVFVAGAGLVADVGVSLRRTSVTGNIAAGRGVTGSVRGGGIFDATVPEGPPGGPLVLVNSSVTGNVLTGSAGVSLQGGGIYVRHPITSTRTVVTGNSPDQCDGC